jgi:hypothetical protein
LTATCVWLYNARVTLPTSHPDVIPPDLLGRRVGLHQEWVRLGEVAYSWASERCSAQDRGWYRWFGGVEEPAGMCG